jgi:hypothetical protein
MLRRTSTVAAAMRHDIRTFAAAATVGLALVVSGCGSSGTSSSSSAPAATTSASTPTSSASTTTSSSSTSSAASGGTTKAGTTLSPGETALVDYKPGDESSSPTYRLQLNVLSIKQGSKADLNGVELEKAQQGQTPYYVTLKIRNEGPGNASAEDGVPTASFQATDDRGEQGQELSVIGNFRPCESGTQPKQFTKGVTYQTCVIYMVGGGGSIVNEKWTGSGDAYSENPIVWKAG